MLGTSSLQIFIARAQRFSGIFFGFANQAVFLITVYFLFYFLRDGSVSFVSGSWILVDTLLALLFAVVHSLLLYPAVRRKLSQWIPSSFYDSFFSSVTCISLLALFFCWRNSTVVLWQLSGVGFWIVSGCFYASWLALLYSLALTGLGYQNGWTPFYYWLIRERPPRRSFEPRGAYKHLRHPVYLSFLGLVWFVPRMTLDHAILTAIWTVYIFYGSVLKDRRLLFFIGKPYRHYMETVKGYPLMWRGPLAKLSPSDQESSG